ncbi:FAD-dependent oxidoreductase [Pseudonocardia sp. GCM10023141]|uniref:FAD-dependent oxidoreductase n=1 Tax=Pseudonocardia sp. GCM10023141 TaxID=3252653 RepID=UPI00361466A5
MPRRLVVVGGGAAGMSAASAARRIDPELGIVVLEAGGYVSYGVCGLPYYLSGVVEHAEELLAHPASWFVEHRRLDLRLHARAVALDPDRRVVRYVQDGAQHDLSYTALVVAAGGAPTVPELPGPPRPTFTIRTLEDAIALRSLLDAGTVRSALVVGAGYIGLEMAEALHARGCAVTVVERLPRVLTTLDAEVAARVEDHVREHVELRLGVGSEPLPAADVVVLATGVVPTGGIAADAGATTGPRGALLVDDRMRTSLPGVWAAGDCIAPWHRVLGAPAFVPLGPAANKTGRVAGTVAAGGDATFDGVVGTAVVKVFDLEVAHTGLTHEQAGAAGLAAVATDVVGRSRAKYYPGATPLHVRLVHEAGGRLLGAQLVGREGAAKRIDVTATALHAGLTVTDLAALDLSYAPPYAPVYDPLILAAQAARRKLVAAV